MDFLIELACVNERSAVSDFFFYEAKESEDLPEQEQQIRVSQLPVRINSSNFKCTGFTGHQTLLHFHMDLYERVDFRDPPVIDLWTVHHLKGEDLRLGWKRNVLIKDYISYSNTKGRIFRNLLRTEEQFGWIWKQPQPVIVGSAGVFALMMKSPFDVVQLSANKWTVYAWMQDGVIFFKELHELRNERNVVTYGSTDQYNPKHPRLNLYRKLMSIGQDEQVNEHEKHFKISDVHLNDLCLVVQSEVNAVTAGGEEVKIADRRHDWKDEEEKVQYFAQRFLQLWAYAQLAGQKKIIMGKKRANTLQDVEVLDASKDSMVEYMERELSPISYLDGQIRRSWCPEQASDFLYRLLAFVRDLLTDPRTGGQRAIRLSYRRGATSFIRPQLLSLEETATLIKDA